jgi:hypothetical protein
MKAMIVISYIICALGLFGGVTMLIDGDTSGGVMAIGIYAFFLALTVNIKK